MNDDLNFDTYLYIGSRKLIIKVNTDTNKRIYNEEVIFDEINENLDFVKLDIFLNKNIFKIEKNLKRFVEKIIVILDLDNFFPVEISIKRRSFESIIDLKSLNHLLIEAKDSCKKTINENKILHMIINNYHIDNKDFPILPKDINGKNFSLDLKFICISDDFIKRLEEVLKKYQISLNQIVSANYIKDFLKKSDEDIFSMTKKMVNGYNPNEVLLVNKTRKNEGFFEKFFNFFN